MSGLQVLTPTPANSDVRLAQRIQELEKRLAALESRQAILPVIATTPGAGTGAEGQVVLTADPPPRMWAKINGTWLVV